VESSPLRSSCSRSAWAKYFAEWPLLRPLGHLPASLTDLPRCGPGTGHCRMA